MTGCIIVNGFFSNESTIDQQQSLTKAFLKLGVKTEIIKNVGDTAFIKDGKVQTTLKDYDFIVYLDKDLHVAKMLEKKGYKLFNTAKAIEACDDKMLTYIALSSNGFLMPTTISAPLMYANSDNDQFIDKTIQKLGLPLVVKKVYGSMGNGVFLATTKEEVKEIYNSLKLQPHIYQQYIGKGYGEDIRVIVVGDNVIASMKRVNENDFRSNVEQGGRCVPFELPKEAQDLAKDVCKILGLCYAGVDLIEKDGKYYVCEVNSNAFFKGIQTVSNVDIAFMFAKYVVDCINLANN